MRAVFFGTPEFALPSLEALLQNRVGVDLVVTRPDRPVGRHGAPRPSAVAAFAQERGLTVEKPARLRGEAGLLERVRELAPDVGVVVAYGRILPAELLEIPRLKFVNVHASLLPRHRGASPVQAAILEGDSETGVVTMRVVEELDAGPLYLESRTPVGEREDAGTLSKRLAAQGGALLAETLRGLAAGTLTERSQVGEVSSTAPLRREDGEVDWTRPAVWIERARRAFTPWPGLHSFLGRERIKLLQVSVGPPAPGRAPGELWLEEGKTSVAAGEGTSIILESAQRAGRKPVSGVQLLRGIPATGARFGSDPGASR